MAAKKQRENEEEEKKVNVNLYTTSFSFEGVSIKLAKPTLVYLNLTPLIDRSFPSTSQPREASITDYSQPSTRRKDTVPIVQESCRDH